MKIISINVLYIDKHVVYCVLTLGDFKSGKCKGITVLGEGHVPCHRDAIPRSEWCIFHYPEKPEEFAKTFDEELRKDIERQIKEHPNYLDFAGFDFPNEIHFVEDFKRVDFRKAIFRKKAFFTRKYDELGLKFQGWANFSGVEFHSEVFFDFALFSHGVEFLHAKFQDFAYFSYVQFEKASFMACEFQEGVTFSSSSFNGEAVFRWAKFHRHVIFAEAEFHSEANFKEVVFKDFCDFSSSVFHNDLSLRLVSLDDIIIFEHTQVNNRLWINPRYMGNHQYNIIKFSNVIFGDKGKIIISGSMGDIVNDFICGILFRNTELTHFEFIDEVWHQKYRRKVITDEILLRLKEEPEHEILDQPSSEQVIQSYRRLRENFEDSKRYSEAGDFFIGEMEIIRNYSPIFFTRFLYTVYYGLSSYGESIALPLIWSALIIFIVAGFNVLFFVKPIPELFLTEYLASLVNTFQKFLPFSSVSTFMDLVTKLLGTLLFGLIFIGLRRKLERR